ncbi:MAG TPA: Ig-like domain repeat protein [Terracidiphilus sp.]|nr:Ig-like domain repeat protein [Terracidiphilus sp.]
MKSSMIAMSSGAFARRILGLGCLLISCASAQTAKQSITLDPPTGWELQAHSMKTIGEMLPPAPANFRRLGEATVGEPADLHTLTLRFSETAKLTAIKSTPDFRIEQGGSCEAGNTYAKNTTCTLLVRFTPQGAGNRLGHLTVSTNLSPTPMAFGLGGYGYSPIISFVPAVISTVPGTYPSSKGLLSGAQNLTVDGGDTLWIADTGNGLIRQMDSSGNFITLASGYPSPVGIAVDTFGEAWFDTPSTGTMYEIYDYGPVAQASGAGTASCPVSAPCTLGSEALGTPGEMSMDPYNHLFFTDNHAGAAISTVLPEPANLIFLYDPFPYQTNPSSAMAVDAGDNLYTLWTNSGSCQILQQTLNNAENNYVNFNKIAGGHTCGFAGDGGLAGNAELGNKIGQFAFDAAGNMYFSDTANQRVRRIDYTTGVINTIAGTGTAGYYNDGFPATIAYLNNPTGVAVNSQGDVYIISSANTSGQVIRKVGPNGFIYFGGTTKGLPTAPHMVTVSNTGNSAEVLTSFVKNGTNPSNFVIDPNTTTCNLASGMTLYSGQSCKIGVIFTPTSTTTQTANLVLVDNTISGMDTITLNGQGKLAVATVVINSPTPGQTFASGSAVTFKVTVSGVSGLPTPTGTVQFKVDGANYGSPVALSSGVASTSVTGLSSGSHTLSALYLGDANYAASSAAVSVSITVSAPPPAAATTMVTLAPASTRAAASPSCAPTAFAVIVSSTTYDMPTGDVRLLEGETVLASGTLVNGKVMLSGNGLGRGTHNLIARYLGDALHLPSNSSVLTEVVSRPGGCMPARVGSPIMPHFRME